MPGIYFTRVANDKSGFTNQIFTLIHAMLEGLRRGNNIVVVDSFQRDFDNTDNRINLCDLFDLDQTNKFLEKYNLKLICKSKFNYKLNAVFYGNGENVIDITDKSHATIKPKSFNRIGGDPIPGVPKELFINYEIHGEEYSNIYREDYPFDIWVKGPPKYEYLFKWIPQDKNVRFVFEDILRNIKYQQQIDNISFLPLLKDDKINVVHLRLEADAIQHWSKQNNMSESAFKTHLEDIYIDLICKHIDPSQKTILVGCKTNSKIMDFLKTFKYNYEVYHCGCNGREINAVYDLIQASQCNETFISNFNYENLNGSTFSYYISLLSKAKRTISVDLDNLKTI
jgi:hypothetical protein